MRKPKASPERGCARRAERFLLIPNKEGFDSSVKFFRKALEET